MVKYYLQTLPLFEPILPVQNGELVFTRQTAKAEEPGLPESLVVHTHSRKDALIPGLASTSQPPT